jgi:hypothetical protein
MSEGGDGITPSPTTQEVHVKVAQLVAKLQSLPQDTEVVLVDEDGMTLEIFDVTMGWIRQKSYFLAGNPTEKELEEEGLEEHEVTKVAGILAGW